MTPAEPIQMLPRPDCPAEPPPALPALTPRSRRTWLGELLFGPESDEVLTLRTRVAELEGALAVERLQGELLAEVNENLRRWLLASTAAAKAAGDLLGAAPLPPRGRG